MLPDRVSNPESLTYESGALPTALRGPAKLSVNCQYITQLLPCLPVYYQRVTSLVCPAYCAAYQRSAICDEFGESAGCNCLIG